MAKEEIIKALEAGDTALGLELGSTNIKAVLVDGEANTIAEGSFGWENQLEDGIWTYSLEAVWKGIQTCYAELAADVEKQYGVKLTKIGSFGVSAMMHGYLAFDKEGQQLSQFRTWRNNITGEAAKKLTELLNFNIPQRWSIAHLYQAILNGEKEVPRISFLTTLAGYVHWQLTGEKVLGVGDASGMFPIDQATGGYDADMLLKFQQLTEVKGCGWRLAELLPRVLKAGEQAGELTAEGAKLLDPSGTLAPGTVCAPPEGDAGTGMVSTNAVRPGTGNISVGTSAFSMNVLSAPLASVHEDIDVVMTPDGATVAMVHTNNCTSDLNAWVGLFEEFAGLLGSDVKGGKLYSLLLSHTKEADRDAGGLLNYSCLSGENVTRVDKGRPLFVRGPKAKMHLPEFMLTQLYGALAPLAVGMQVLTEEEHVEAESMVAQGGLLKTPEIAQQALADLLGVPITVMETAGSGGPWGMAVLALYLRKKNEHESLPDFLERAIFAEAKSTTLPPKAESRMGANAYLRAYKEGLELERAAGQHIAE